MIETDKEPLYKFIKVNYFDYGHKGRCKAILFFAFLFLFILSILPDFGDFKLSLLSFSILVFVHWFLQFYLNFEYYFLSFYVINTVSLTLLALLGMFFGFMTTYPYLPFMEWVLSLIFLLFYLGIFWYYSRVDIEKTKKDMRERYYSNIKEAGVVSLESSVNSGDIISNTRSPVKEAPFWLIKLAYLSLFLMVSFSIGIYIVNKMNPMDTEILHARFILFSVSVISIMVSYASLVSLPMIKPLIETIRILKEESIKMEKGD